MLLNEDTGYGLLEKGLGRLWGEIKRGRDRKEVTDIMSIKIFAKLFCSDLIRFTDLMLI